MDKLSEWMQVVEECCRIDDSGTPRKRNKFSILEEKILKNKVELQEQMSDFTHQVNSTRGFVDNLEKNIECLSKKIDINVSKLLFWLALF